MLRLDAHPFMKSPRRARAQPTSPAARAARTRRARITRRALEELHLPAVTLAVEAQLAADDGAIARMHEVEQQLARFR